MCVGGDIGLVVELELQFAASVVVGAVVGVSFGFGFDEFEMG